ncbi:hypothetical protein CAPTEDRAFT_208831 [Capitella teleta]|uniref:Ig-like domain-containing protein n=1 Tax=Capitella teleta TaxID=283909 RepID=R7UF44_CAPTE|nr:hypothetical protein CAPTEDRAFT_208831 [Capitella teleta]|eukprot:ELU02408.1 hypothetical protein CAPTEDRAFT_208831 [Capitella teleta]
MLKHTILLLFLVVATKADDDAWIYVVSELGENATLDCEMSTYPNDTIPMAWMLPDFTILPLNYTSERLTVDEYGYNLSITNVEKADFGLYHCMMITEDDLTYMNRLGLNVKGPYFEDIWDKYETNFLIGVCAFGSFLFLALSSMYAYQHRWESTSDEMEFAKGSNNGLAGYTNEAIDNDYAIDAIGFTKL